MELGVKIKSEWEAAAALEPHPDIHELFCHYNSLYFNDALNACIVDWSDSRTAKPLVSIMMEVIKLWPHDSPQVLGYLGASGVLRSAGMCSYLEDGGCEIRLSVPLLKFRSTADLKNTLLHEMIHAFLYVTSNKRDHSYHGPSFSAIMNVINSSAETDHQRPSGGYNITFSHVFRKRVDICRVQYWTCTSCGDVIEGSTNREPSANDCVENVAHDNSCGNSSCRWHRHKMLCSGRYTKTTGKPEYKNKMRVPKDAQENDRVKSKGQSYRTRQTIRSQNVEETIDLSSVKMPNTVDDVRSRSSGIKSPSCYTNHSLRNATKKQLKATPLKKEADPLTFKIPKRPRTAGSTVVPKSNYPGEESFPKCKKELQKSDCLENQNFPKRKKEIIADSQWFAVYGDEESDKDIKPLVNSRTERRKREKLAKLKERFPDAEAVARSSQDVDVARSSQYAERSRTGTALVDRRKAHNAPPPEDKVVYILDDD